ncbi:MAG: T9SS type A sorting domain-containing protein, partial [Bacteroidota bacterium]
TLLILWVSGSMFTSAFAQYASVEPDDFFESPSLDAEPSHQSEGGWRYEPQEAGEDLQIAFGSAHEITKVTLKSPLGKVIKSYEMSPYENPSDSSINTEGLDAGLYLVILETALQTTSEVLVIK